MLNNLKALWDYVLVYIIQLSEESVYQRVLTDDSNNGSVVNILGTESGSG